MFRGHIFALRTQCDSPIEPSVLSAIDEHGGQVLPASAPLAGATHIVLQHQKQSVYSLAVQQHKTTVNSYWLLACVEAKRLLPVGDPLHCPFPSSKIHGASECGVSVTSFQGLQRQVLLDMLRCMGVEVQKEMRLNAVTHIIARDVDDRSSKKLEHARKPEWAATISIVSCKWIYDCVTQWKILPTDAYKGNCSGVEAVSWHGRPSTVSKPQASPAPTAAPSTALVSPLQGATTGGALAHMQAGSAVVAAQPQQAVAVPVMMATATLAAAPAAAAVRHQQGRQNPSKHASHTPVPTGLGTGLGKGPTSRHQVDNDSELLQSASAEEHGVRRDRESLGGTQGAITGLAHMALQRHDQAVQLPTASADHSGLDSQQMALQVADAEAATAKLIAQMTASPSEDADAAVQPQLVPMHHHNGPSSSGVHHQQQQQQQSSDRENVPEQQQQQQRQRGGKRGSGVQSNAAHALARKQVTKRRKVSTAEGSAALPAQQPAARSDQGIAGQEEARQVLSPVADEALDRRANASRTAVWGSTEGLDPERVVGCSVEQQFEEGLFKGTVKKYNKKNKWFRVEYEDGDRQDLTWTELQPILLPDPRLQDAEAPSAKPAKPKRKLQKVSTHRRELQAKPAAAAAPGSAAAVPTSRPSAGIASQAGPTVATQAAAKGRAAKTASAKEAVDGREDTATAQMQSDCDDHSEAVLADVPVRRNTLAGARSEAGNSPQSASKRGKEVLALGGMHTHQQRACSSKLASIGVRCLTHKQCPRWNPSITHVILPALVRSVKSLAGMAGGRWILHADFIDACASAEALMEPDEFEFESGSKLISPHAPRHWRERHDLQGTGAFHMLHVLIYGACDKPGPNKEDIATIVESGGGLVTKCEKPCTTLTKALARGVHLAIMSADRTAADPGVRQLLKAKLPCATAHFLVEWLAHPEHQLSDYLLFDSQIEGSAQLVEAAACRVAITRPHQMSPQI